MKRLVKLIFKIRLRLIAEISAVLFSLAYTLLYLNEFPICYVFGFLGSLLLSWVYVKERLYAEVVLQWVYAGMAIYGGLHPSGWQQNIPMQFNHVLLISGGVLMVFVLGNFLRYYSDSDNVWTDSFVAISAIIGTWLMVNYSNDCWLYLFASNVVALFLCMKKGLVSASILYIVYLLFSIDGYWNLQISNKFSFWIALHLGLL